MDLNLTYTYTMGILLRETDSYKYLGAIFTTQNKTFQSNYKNIRTNALKAIGSLRQKLKTNVRKYTSFYLLMRFFDSYVMPILDYGAEVWFQGTQIKELEFVQLWYLKTTLGIKSQTSNMIVYGDTGRFPLLLRQQDIALKYWDRLRQMDNSKPLFKIYSDLQDLHNDGHRTWFTKVIEIIQPHQNAYGGLQSLISNHDKSIYRETKSIRYETYTQNYFCAINNVHLHPILRTYSKFKTTPRCEPHLLIPINIKYQKALSRFRSSSHHLRIETGRHTVPITPLLNRICQHCSSLEIDDEIHMLLRCEFHVDERLQLFSELPAEFMCVDQDNLFKKLLNNSNESVIRSIGKYVHTCFERRNHTDEENVL